MFVFVILFYHKFLIKSIVNCPRSWTFDYSFKLFLSKKGKVVEIKSYHT